MTVGLARSRSAPGAVGAHRGRLLGIGIGLGLIVLVVIASVVLGARQVSWQEVLAALSGSTASYGEVAVAERLPRTVLALVVGAALGLSGALMQAVTRNPLADPGILGVNTGAALFVVAGIAFTGAHSLEHYIVLALSGASLSAVFVYLIGSMGRGGATPIKLALAGAATTAALSSLISAILLPRIEVMSVFRFWQVGSVGGATWEGLATITPLLGLGAAIGLISGGALNALALGDDVATGLGVHTGRVRMVGALAGVILCGAATAIAGPIAFVGLMVPHTVRLVTGPDQRWLLPLSAIAGAIVLTSADVLGRLIGQPGEIEAGVVTAFIGAPFLIVIARRARMRAL